MSVINSFFSAILMYSRLPAPNVEWNEENRRYSLVFFPFIGAVIGGVLILWKMICDYFSFGKFLYAAVCTVIPVMITGGIHIDGFCDVNDAVSSFAEKEKKLEIMKDPHVGSFAIIKLCIYFLIQTALFSEAESLSAMIICALGFIQSRAFSALAAVTLPNARGEGSLHNFTKPAHKKVTVAAEIFYILLTLGLSLFIDAKSAAAAFLCGIGIFVYYVFFSKKNFGGITGDLAGYFLCLYEIWFLAGAVIPNIIMR